MVRPLDSEEFALFLKPPLLITESEEDFASLNAALEQEIKPRGVVERMYVYEVAYLVWEILRLRRCKVAMINAAFEDALIDLLGRLTDADRNTRKAVASDWFSEPQVKKDVSDLLVVNKLDESAIEAKAIQCVSAELEVIDRMQTSLESRRNKALRCIAETRQNLAKQLEQAANRILDDDDVPRLVAIGKRSD